MKFMNWLRKPGCSEGLRLQDRVQLVWRALDGESSLPPDGICMETTSASTGSTQKHMYAPYICTQIVCLDLHLLLNLASEVSRRWPHTQNYRMSHILVITAAII